MFWKCSWFKLFAVTEYTYLGVISCLLRLVGPVLENPSTSSLFYHSSQCISTTLLGLDDVSNDLNSKNIFGYTIEPTIVMSLCDSSLLFIYETADLQDFKTTIII